MHKRFVINIISRIILVACCCMAAPLGWALYDDPHSRETKAFLLTIFLGAVVACALLWIFPVKKEYSRKIGAKDCLAIVGLSWVLLMLFGAIPLYLAGVVSHYTDAVFEITSGFTTTGSSIFSDVEILPRGILFWRSLTTWLGGAGIVVLYIALLPAVGVHTFQLYEAEAAGLSTERIAPQIRETAKKLLGVYLFLSLCELIALIICGMPGFDALCHTFATIATAGFSTKNASIGVYGPPVQWVVTLFMFLGGVNFVLFYRALKGKPLNFFKDEEFRTYFFMMAILIPFFAWVLLVSNVSAAPLREAAFQVVSIATSTGFVTADFDLWPSVLKFILMLLIFVGGCGGSTAGGLKVIRALLSVKIVARNTLQAVFPNAILPVKFNGKALEDKMVTGVLSFFSLYLLMFFGGTLVLIMTDGTDIVTAMTAAVTAMSNCGPGLGQVGPMHNFGWISVPGKWVLSFLMLAGRLEFYALLILFVPATWEK
ncbi:MAG: TrkH family potassium uptake protein [Candidatus Omnitrophica bacterium]|nr:TrkH family potassium uptake protein [Candidatus Omnitrophota bacterium]